MLEHRYGEFTKQQISEIKQFLRKQIFLLLIYVDPETNEEYKHVNVDNAFMHLLYKLGGLNSILCEPPELVTVISLLEAARIEYGKGEENFDFKIYRKLVLDSGAEILKIKEV